MSSPLGAPIVSKKCTRRHHAFSYPFAGTTRRREDGLYLPQSRHHVSFANLVYDERQWVAERASVYEQLSLFEEQDAVASALKQQFNEIARQAMRGMASNPFASVINGKLKLHTRDALPITNEVKALRGLIEASLARVRIEDLLRDVDAATHFTRVFRPLSGYESRDGSVYPTLLAAIIAHGTNLGIAAMGHSAQGITADMLQHVSQWFLREETIKAANAALVDLFALSYLLRLFVHAAATGPGRPAPVQTRSQQRLWLS
jgi:hypothetical protein